jgi:hypothetical protein
LTCRRRLLIANATVPDLSSLFATSSEGTHFGESGATQVAGVVASALKAGSLPLRTFVK